jgi:ABC-type transporter Mla MlaB component
VCVPAEGRAEALAHLGRLLAGGCSVVVALDPRQRLDVGMVAALARLALTARRCGGALAVQASDGALGELADLMGLSEILGLAADPAGLPAAGRDPGSGQAQR